MINGLLQIGCVLFSILCIIQLGNKNRTGFIMGMLSQIFYVTLFIRLQTYALLIPEAVYLVLGLRAWYKWGTLK